MISILLNSRLNSVVMIKVISMGPVALELLYEVPYRPSTLWGQRQLDHFSRNWRKIQYFALKTALKSAKMNPIMQQFNITVC